MRTVPDKDKGDRPNENEGVNGHNERNPEVYDEEALADAAGNGKGDDWLGGGAERGDGDDVGNGEEREQHEVKMRQQNWKKRSLVH